MTELYDTAVASHYAAFRPPLHAMLLARVLADHERFSLGIDIGCGTGYSAIALARYCDQVFGLDPSQEMLTSAAPHPGVSYICGLGDELGMFRDHEVEIASFIGSLYYTKRDTLRRALSTVCVAGATVIVGDFEVLLGETLARLDMQIPAVDSDYDHAVNLLDWPEFEPIINATRRASLELTPEELAHVLLADSNRYARFVERFAKHDPLAALVAELSCCGVKQCLEAELYFSRYRLKSQQC